MVKCETCKFFLQKYEVVGICNWTPLVEIPISWRNHIPGTMFVTAEREHECPTHEYR